jgi:hypothetical protein
MANPHRDSGKEQYWRDLLARQAASGLNVARYCQREGLSLPSFYAWRRTIAQRDGAPRQPHCHRAFQNRPRACISEPAGVMVE